MVDLEEGEVETPSHRRPQLPAATAEGLRSQVSASSTMKHVNHPLRHTRHQHSPCVSHSPQVEHYFSDENLAKDQFLRSKMDQNGVVPMSVISGFARCLLSSTPACMDPSLPLCETKTLRPRLLFTSWRNQASLAV
jgi:hypothetical protein